MLAFRNKCKRNDEELHKMVRSMDESTTIVEILDDNDTKENSDANSEFSFEPDDENRETMTGKDSQKDLGSVNDTDESEKRRFRPEKVACHICGKLYEMCKLKFHINRHNGKCRSNSSNRSIKFRKFEQCLLFHVGKSPKRLAPDVPPLVLFS